MFLLGLIVSVCYIPGVLGALVPTQWAVLSAILPLGLWYSNAKGSEVFLGLGALAFAALSLAWALNTYDAGYGLWLAAIWSLCFWWGAVQANFAGLYAGLACGLGVSSMIAVAQILGYQPVEASAGSIFATGLFFNSTQLGAIAALVLIGLVSRQLWWYIPPVLPALVLSGSRGAAITLGLTMLAYLTRWPYALAAFLICFGAAAIAPSNSDIQRLMLWGVALREFNLLGHGIGSFNTYLYYNPNEYYANATNLFHPEFVHNDYLQLWFELGVASLGMFAIYFRTLSQHHHPDWPVFVGFATLGLFYFPLWCPVLAFIGLATAGRIASDRARLWAMLRGGRCDLLPRPVARPIRSSDPRSQALSSRTSA